RHGMRAARAVVGHIGQKGQRLLAPADPLLANADRNQSAVQVEVVELLTESVDAGAFCARARPVDDVRASGRLVVVLWRAGTHAHDDTHAAPWLWRETDPVRESP